MNENNNKRFLFLLKDFWKNNKYTLLVLVFAFFSILYTVGQVQEHTNQQNDWWIEQLNDCQCMCDKLGIGTGNNTYQEPFSLLPTTNNIDGVDTE